MSTKIVAPSCSLCRHTFVPGEDAREVPIAERRIRIFGTRAVFTEAESSVLECWPDCDTARARRAAASPRPGEEA